MSDDDDDVPIVPASKRRAIGAKDTGAVASPIGKPVVAKKVAVAKKPAAKDTGAVADSPIGKPVDAEKTKKAMKVSPKKRSNQRRLPKEGNNV